MLRKVVECAVMSNDKQTRNNSLLNFDEWASLAKSDPEEFEAKRLRKIETFFNGVPAKRQQRLKGLQWQVDQARKLAHSPMASCIAISTMMLDSVSRLSEHQYELVNITLKQGPQKNKPKPVSAVVLSMPTRTH
jgi:hypothetical protein